MRSLVFRCVAGLAFACIAVTSHAQESRRFGDNACLAQGRSPELQPCADLAREVSHDIDALRALGDELERGGRYDAAVAAYEIGLAAHPDNRNLLQRLIHSRGQARALRMLSGKAAAPAASSPPANAATTAAEHAVAKARDTSVAAQSASPAARALLPPAPRRTGRYLALVIGNERYANFARLRTPAADVRALAAVLRSDYGFTVTELMDATRYQIVSALSRLRREATGDDNVLIYYAGHGYLDESTSRGYWLPVDAEQDSIANWLSTSDVTDILAGLGARHALVLADSCFSGTLLRSDPTIALDERHSLLEKLATRRSRSIMTSGGLEPVTDGGRGRHSVFAAALLRALRENDQPLEAARLFMQIRDRVAAEAAQTPQYGPMRNAGHDGGDFIFARSAGGAR
jgi:hypothetical protein